MARIRTIKPEIFTDEKTGSMSDRAFKLFAGLLTLADDYGVAPHNLAEWKAKLFPYEAGHHQEVIGKAWAELLGLGVIQVFTAPFDNEERPRQYIWIRNFLKHQKVDRPSRPLIDGWERTTTPETLDLYVVDSSIPRDPSMSTRRSLDEHSSPEGKGREGNPSGGETSPPAPSGPTQALVAYYVNQCKSHGYEPDAELRGQMGSKAKRLLAEKPQDLVESAIRIIADERKSPSALSLVIADIEHGRSSHGQPA